MKKRLAQRALPHRTYCDWPLDNGIDMCGAPNAVKARAESTDAFKHVVERFVCRRHRQAFREKWEKFGMYTITFADGKP